MRTLVSKLIPTFLVVFLMGCGGSGDNGSTISIADSFMNRYASALESSNPDRVASLISNLYENSSNSGCVTKADIVNNYVDALNSGYTFREDIQNVGNEFRQGDLIQFDAQVRERVYLNGNLDSDQTFTDTFVIVDEGGTWRLYGDQSCTSANRGTVKSRSIMGLSGTSKAK